MSKRNTRAAKARRQKQRAAARNRTARPLAVQVDVQLLDELVELADRGAVLRCGCDAHQLLHELLGLDPVPSCVSGL
jgi:hypothetical protein